MAKYYQPIDGKNLTFDKYVIEKVLDVAGSIIESSAVYFKTPMHKFAFYYAGELCEVQFNPGSPVFCVRCHGVLRRKEVLGWLKSSLITQMKSFGWETEISEDKDDYFYARFYQEEK
jgi:hypothetical protein